MQPHRYSRLRDLFEDFSTCFNDADYVYVADVYAAGEEPIEGISAPSLAESFAVTGIEMWTSHPRRHWQKTYTPILHPGDLDVCLGAGDITYWAADLAEQLVNCEPIRPITRGARELAR